MLESFIKEGLRGKSKTTIKSYHYALKQFQKWLKGCGTTLEEFSRSDVQQYIDYLVAHKKSAATINKVWNAIKKYCAFAGKTEAVNEIAVVKPPNYRNQAPKALSKNDRNRLIREVDRTDHNRNFAIIMTLLNTGVRVSELVNIDLTDINMSDRKGTIKVIGKGNKERTIPLNSESRRAIQKYLDERNDSQPALFLSNRNKRISVRSVQYLLNKYGFNVHQTRHTFITDLQRNGVDFTIIQSLSGHQSVDMLSRYSMPSEDDKQQVVEKLFK